MKQIVLPDVPPMALAGIGVVVVGGIGIVLLAGIGLVDKVAPLLAARHHAVDSAPVGQAAHIPVVDEEIGLQLTRKMRVVVGGLLRIVTVGGIELHTTFATPVDGSIKQLAFTAGPQHQAVMVLDEHLQRLDGKRTFLTNLRVSVFDDCAVEIYCDDHVRCKM